MLTTLEPTLTDSDRKIEAKCSFPACDNASCNIPMINDSTEAHYIACTLSTFSASITRIAKNSATSSSLSSISFC